MGLAHLEVVSLVVCQAINKNNSTFPRGRGADHVEIQVSSKVEERIWRLATAFIGAYVCVCVGSIPTALVPVINVKLL